MMTTTEDVTMFPIGSKVKLDVENLKEHVSCMGRVLKDIDDQLKINRPYTVVEVSKTRKIIYVTLEEFPGVKIQGSHFIPYEN